MLFGTGKFATRADLAKPQVGISAVWWDGNPCNAHLGSLANAVSESLDRAAELVPMRFNTIGVSDAISMGTEGMKASLPSRDIIADSIECVMVGQWYDANISIPGCDKNMPGVLMAMARFNRPSLMIYGGTIAPGTDSNGKSIQISDCFEKYGGLLAGKVDSAEMEDIIRHACPGPGGCGGIYTANTMAAAAEAMGMTLPGSSSAPAISPQKLKECTLVGACIKTLLEKDIKPRDIMTRAAFMNALTLITVLGGSTNAVIHLLAIARAADVLLTLDDFQRCSDKTPFLADMKPSGRYVMQDLFQVGGTPAVLKLLLDHAMIDGSIVTVTGNTLAENLRGWPGLEEGQDVIRPLSNPIKKTGHIQILYGNLAPSGSVAKITGKEGPSFSGLARVFDSEEALLGALAHGEIKNGEKTVVVIRYVGPKGGPGMPEMLKPTAAIVGAGLGMDCAFVSDGRFSGASHGFIIGHVTPEAWDGGVIALLKDGDRISIEPAKHEIRVEVGEEELARRKGQWRRPKAKYTRGFLAKYARDVKSASEGCVTDEVVFD